MRAGAAVLGVCLLVLLRGAWKGAGVYSAFLRGAGEGMRTALGLLPALCAMLLMLRLLEASGLMGALGTLISPALGWAGVPKEVAPMLLLRPLSGSGSLAALEQIIDGCGVDSRAARVAAVLMGSSETVFYTLTVYLGATKGIRRLPWVVGVSLVAYGVGALVAGWAVP